ncbi:MAG: hypothetical protein R6W73_05825 [Candidatus Saliniplasma sp.]
MKLYVELYFSSEGVSPQVVIKKMKEMGFKPVVGRYDLAKEYNSPKEYGEIVKQLETELKGTDIRYRLITKTK